MTRSEIILNQSYDKETRTLTGENMTRDDYDEENEGGSYDDDDEEYGAEERYYDTKQRFTVVFNDDFTEIVGGSCEILDGKDKGKIVEQFGEENGLPFYSEEDGNPWDLHYC